MRKATLEEHEGAEKARTREGHCYDMHFQADRSLGGEFSWQFCLDCSLQRWKVGSQNQKGSRDISFLGVCSSIPTENKVMVSNS